MSTKFCTELYTKLTSFLYLLSTYKFLVALATTIHVSTEFWRLPQMNSQSTSPVVPVGHGELATGDEEKQLSSQDFKNLPSATAAQANDIMATITLTDQA